MLTLGSERVRDEIILLARILLVVLFVVFGWSKLTGFTGTVAYMVHDGVPLPELAAIVAVVVEFFFSLLLVLGVLTRPLALVMALYTIATGFIGHHYWTLTGAAQAANEINFFKNVSIAGGFLLLYVTGAGRYALDAIIEAQRGVVVSPLV